MTRTLIFWTVAAGLLCVGSASAQDAGDTADARSQLEMRKREQVTQFDAQQQACAGTFAVTDCVNEVNARRRVVVAALRKEENTLNELERRQRERQRLESLQEKARQKSLQAPHADLAGETMEDRLQRQQDKLGQHVPQSTPKATSVKKDSVAIDPQSRQRNSADYAERQRALEARRAARDKKLREQDKAQVDLPTPP